MTQPSPNRNLRKAAAALPVRRQCRAVLFSFLAAITCELTLGCALALGLLSFNFLAAPISQVRADEPGSDASKNADAKPADAATPAKDDAAAKDRESKDGEKKDHADGAAKPDEGKSADDKSADADKDKSKDKSAAESPQPVKRPEKPAKDPDPTELKVQPDAEGMVSFSFRGQPWQAVLEWLADISHMSLDWEEVPGGYLDLATRRKYTVAEARDLINSILLTKGFTLLRNGEVLIVSDLKHLDVSLVPVVLPSELDGRGTFELVRIFFNLDRLQAEPMVEELKPLLSPVGKEHISALKTTNRLDILDTAGTLRRVREVVGAEQGESGKEHQLREFQLHNARADDVLATLKQLLGIPPEKTPGGGGNNNDQMQQMQQMMQQMQQQAQQQNGGDKKPRQQQQEEKIYLTINRRENSIMALATPDKLAVIEQAVQLLDVPTAGVSPLAAVQRVQMYRLVAADPAPIVSVLKDLGNLDPSTRLEVDNVNHAIIVSGPLVDHVTVRALIEKLDGSARRFEVVQLRKLDADYVAGSIEFLMRGPNKDATRPRYVFGDYRAPEQSKDGGFQVEADTKHNRLLLRVNDIELEEIRALLIKLGEDPFGNTQGDNMRVIHSEPGRDTSRLLDQLQRVWPSLSPTPLQLNVDDPKDSDSSRNRDGSKGSSTDDTPDKNGASSDKSHTSERAHGQSDSENSDSEHKSEKQEKKQPAHASPSATAIIPLRLPSGGPAFSVSIDNSPEEQLLRLPQPATAAEKLETAVEKTAQPATINTVAANDVDGADSNADRSPLRMPPDDRRTADNTPAGNAASGSPFASSSASPAISITRGPQGLIVTSRDPAALDQFMKLVDELSPADSRYHVFMLKHTYAKDVASLLETVFSEEAQKQRDNFSVYYFFDEQPQEKKEDRNRLSKREPLRFTPDPVTNSILVQGADDDQLAEIKSLIELYDREEPPDSQSIRRTQIVAVKYAKAQAVSDIIKEVYRDLLSPNDKALAATGNPQQQQQQRPFYSFYDMGNRQDTTNGVPRFKGLLSVGVDPTSNSLVVSAPQFLLTDVIGMIHKLDDSTKPVEPVVRVISVGGALDDPLIKDALKNVADPEAAKRNAANANQNGNDQDRRNRWNNGRNGPGGNNNNGFGGNGNNNNGQNNNR